MGHVDGRRHHNVGGAQSLHQTAGMHGRSHHLGFAEIAHGTAQTVDVGVEEAHQGAQAYCRARGCQAGQTGAYHGHLAGHHAGDTAKQYALAVLAVGKQRRGHGQGGAAVYLVEDVGKGRVPLAVGDEVEGHGHYAAVEQYAQGVGILVVGVKEGEQQRSAAQAAGVAGTYWRQVEHYVAEQGLLAGYYTCAGAAVALVIVVNGCSGATLYAHVQAAGHEHGRALGGQRETAVDGAGRRCRHAKAEAAALHANLKELLKRCGVHGWLLWGFSEMNLSTNVRTLSRSWAGVSRLSASKMWAAAA